MSSENTKLPDGSEIPRGTGALSALTTARTPSGSDFVAAATNMPIISPVAEGIVGETANFAKGIIGSVSPFLAGQAESEGDQFEHPGSIAESKRFKASELEAGYKANYLDADGNKTSSSRTTPASAMPSVPVGSWRTEDRYRGNYGHDLSQLAWLDPHKLEVSEHEIGSAWGRDRREDAERYAGWMKEGKQAPPIEVVETDSGKLKVSDGHRRHHAAKLAGQQILAWVSPNADTGRRTADGQPIPTALTDELAAKDWTQQQERAAGFATGGHASYGAATQPPAASDVIPAMLTPGEVVLTQEQQRDVAEQAGKTPSEMFGAAKVPGFESQSASLPNPASREESIDKPKTRRERFTRAIGAAAELMGFSKGGKVGDEAKGPSPFGQHGVVASNAKREAEKRLAAVKASIKQAAARQAPQQSFSPPPSQLSIGEAASQPQGDPQSSQQIEAAIDAQDLNRQPDISGQPARHRGQHIQAGIEADGGIILSEALPLIADQRIPKDELEDAREVEALRRQRQEERQAHASLNQPTRPKTTPFSDALADRLLGRSQPNQPTATVPIGKAASFPRDVTPLPHTMPPIASTPQRTGLVDPNPGPPPLPKGLSVAGMKWSDIPREVQALIARQQPELAKQLQSGQTEPPQPAATPAVDPRENDPTYPLATSKTRAQRKVEAEQRAAQERASVVAGLLDDGSSKPVEKPVPTYGLDKSGLPTLEHDTDSIGFDLPKLKPGYDHSSQPHREIGSGPRNAPIGQAASAPTDNVADYVHAMGGMIGGRTGMAARAVGQFMGAKPRGRDSWMSRGVRYLAGGFGGDAGNNGRGGDGRSTTGGGDDGGHVPGSIAGDGGAAGGHFGNAITSGLASGGVIHVWVDGGQIKIDDAAGGRGPSGVGSAQASSTATIPSESSGVTRSPTASRTARQTATPPEDSPWGWAGKAIAGFGRKLRGNAAVKKRMARAATGGGGAVSGMTQRLAKGVGIAGRLGGMASGALGRIAKGGIVGAVASGGAAGGATLGAGAALMAGTGPIGMALAAAAGLAAGLVVTLKAVMAFGEQVNESNRSLARFNGSFSVAFAQLEMQRTIRNLRIANATADTGSNLTRSVNQSEEAWQPAREGMGNITNELGNIAAQISRTIGQSLSTLEKLGVFKQIEQKLALIGDGIELVNDTEEAARDYLEQIAAWFGLEPHREKKKANENQLPAPIAMGAAIAGNDPWKHPAMEGVKQKANKQLFGGRQQQPELK